MKLEPENMSGFKPRKLTITFESQEEMDALAALFNIGMVCDAISAHTGKDICSEIRVALMPLGADPLRHFRSVLNSISGLKMK